MKQRDVCCSFCDTSRKESWKLVAARNNIYICDQCVQLCTEILEEERERENGEMITEPRMIAKCLTIIREQSPVFVVVQFGSYHPTLDALQHIHNEVSFGKILETAEMVELIMHVSAAGSCAAFPDSDRPLLELIRKDGDVVLTLKSLAVSDMPHGGVRHGWIGTVSERLKFLEEGSSEIAQERKALGEKA